ncbi:hypothetical protein ACFL96_16180 [Thermoproteota archaeon]
MLSTGLSYYQNYTAILYDKSKIESEKQSEQIELVRVSIDSGKFNISLQNSGTVTTHLVRLWVTNDTASPSWHDKFDIDYYIAPKGVVSNIGQNLSLSINSSAGYTLKVITDRGSMASYRIVPPSELATSMSLHVSPPSPINGTHVSVLFTVSNNSTSTDALFNIFPQLNVTLPASATAILIDGPIPVSVEELPKGSSTFFKWIYEVGGDKFDDIVFNATLVNGPQNNFVTANATIHYVGFSEQSGSSLSLEDDSESVSYATDGTLYLHNGTILDGYQMGPLNPPFMPASQYVLNSGSRSILFYTKQNDTAAINVPAGNWRFYLNSLALGSDSQLNIKYEVVSNGGLSVISKVREYNMTASQSDTLHTNTQYAVSPVTIAATQRLRLNITWLSGSSLTLEYDNDTVNSRLKTPDSTDYGSAVIKGVQSGEMVITTGQTDTNSINAVVMANSIFFNSVRGSEDNPDSGLIRCWLVSSTQVRCDRDSNDNDYFTIRYYVAEFSSGVNVKRGCESMSSTTRNINLGSPVNLAKSFIVLNGKENSGPGSDSYIDADDFNRARLTSSTNLEIRTYSGSGGTVCWQVVEYDGASVQRNVDSMSGTSLTVDLPRGVNRNQSILLFSEYHSSYGNMADGKFLDSDTIEFTRATNTGTMSISWEVVEFNDNVFIQHDYQSFSTSTTLETITLGTAVNISRAVAFLSGQSLNGMSGGKTTSTGTDPGSGQFTARITSSTQLQLERQITTSATANAGWFVVEFSGAVTGGTPAKFIPYQEYSGGEINVIMKNTGETAIFLTFQTRVVLRDLNSTALYAGVLRAFAYSSTPSIQYDVDEIHDTAQFTINGTLLLFFTQPQTIPCRSSCEGTAITPGNYQGYLHLTGYDEFGAFFARVIDLGQYSW